MSSAFQHGRIALFMCSFLLAFVLVLPTSQAQFDQLLKRTSDKLADEVTRMAVEKLSDIIAQKAAEQIERKFDEMLMKAMEDDSTYQSSYNRDSAMYRMGQDYAAFLNGLNDAADLPEEYNFDVNMLVEVITENDEPQNMRMYFSRTEAIFAIQTATSETESQLILMDFDKDVMVMYKDANGEKTAQAVPNVMKFAGKMANSADVEPTDYTITPIKGKQKIAGFKCYGYEGVSEEDKFEAWMTDDLDIEWQQTFGNAMQNFASANIYNEKWEEMKGVALSQKIFDAKTGELETSFLTKEVKANRITVVNADYSFGQ